MTEVIEDLKEKIKKDVPNGQIPAQSKMIPNKGGVVVVSVIPNSNDFVDGVSEKLGESYKLGQARREAASRGCAAQLRRHFKMVEDFDTLIVFILANQLPFAKGEVLAINGMEMKVDRIEYRKEVESKVVIMRIYLLPVK